VPAIIVDPALQAEVIRQFNLRGDLAPFNLTENVVPIFDIGRLLSLAAPQVVTTTEGSQGIRIGLNGLTNYLAVLPPRLNDGDVFDGGVTINPAAAAVIGDSGQLTAGDNSVHVIISSNVVVQFVIEWRDAADAVTLASWTILAGGPSATATNWERNLNIATDERVRVITAAAVVGTVSVAIDANNYSGSLAT